MPRNKELIKQRNRRLKQRFDHWYHKKRLRYDDVIEKLKDEFFLTSSTIEKYLNTPDES